MVRPEFVGGATVTGSSAELVTGFLFLIRFGPSPAQEALEGQGRITSFPRGEVGWQAFGPGFPGSEGSAYTSTRG